MSYSLFLAKELLKQVTKFKDCRLQILSQKETLPTNPEGNKIDFVNKQSTGINTNNKSTVENDEKDNHEIEIIETNFHCGDNEELLLSNSVNVMSENKRAPTNSDCLNNDQNSFVDLPITLSIDAEITSRENWSSEYWHAARLQNKSVNGNKSGVELNEPVHLLKPVATINELNEGNEYCTENNMNLSSRDKATTGKSSFKSDNNINTSRLTYGGSDIHDEILLEKLHNEIQNKGKKGNLNKFEENFTKHSSSKENRINDSNSHSNKNFINTKFTKSTTEKKFVEKDQAVMNYSPINDNHESTDEKLTLIDESTNNCKVIKTSDLRIAREPINIKSKEENMIKLKNQIQKSGILKEEKNESSTQFYSVNFNTVDESDIIKLTKKYNNKINSFELNSTSKRKPHYKKVEEEKSDLVSNVLNNYSNLNQEFHESANKQNDLPRTETNKNNLKNSSLRSKTSLNLKSRNTQKFNRIETENNTSSMSNFDYGQVLPNIIEEPQVFNTRTEDVTQENLNECEEDKNKSADVAKKDTMAEKRFNQKKLPYVDINCIPVVDGSNKDYKPKKFLVKNNFENNPYLRDQGELIFTENNNDNYLNKRKGNVQYETMKGIGRNVPDSDKSSELASISMKIKTVKLSPVESDSFSIKSSTNICIKSESKLDIHNINSNEMPILQNSELKINYNTSEVIEMTCNSDEQKEEYLKITYEEQNWKNISQNADKDNEGGFSCKINELEDVKSTNNMCNPNSSVNPIFEAYLFSTGKDPKHNSVNEISKYQPRVSESNVTIFKINSVHNLRQNKSGINSNNSSCINDKIGLDDDIVKNIEGNTVMKLISACVSEIDLKEKVNERPNQKTWYNEFQSMDEHFEYVQTSSENETIIVESKKGAQELDENTVWNNISERKFDETSNVEDECLPHMHTFRKSAAEVNDINHQKNEFCSNCSHKMNKHFGKNRVSKSYNRLVLETQNKKSGVLEPITEENANCENLERKEDLPKEYDKIFNCYLPEIQKKENTMLESKTGKKITSENTRTKEDLRRNKSETHNTSTIELPDRIIEQMENLIDLNNETSENNSVKNKDYKSETSSTEKCSQSVRENPLKYNYPQENKDINNFKLMNKPNNKEKCTYPHHNQDFRSSINNATIVTNARISSDDRANRSTETENKTKILGSQLPVHKGIPKEKLRETLLSQIEIVLNEIPFADMSKKYTFHSAEDTDKETKGCIGTADNKKTLEKNSENYGNMCELIPYLEHTNGKTITPYKHRNYSTSSYVNEDNTWEQSFSPKNKLVKNDVDDGSSHQPLSKQSYVSDTLRKEDIDNKNFLAQFGKNTYCVGNSAVVSECNNMPDQTGCVTIDLTLEKTGESIDLQINDDKKKYDIINHYEETNNQLRENKLTEGEINELITQNKDTERFEEENKVNENKKSTANLGLPLNISIDVIDDKESAINYLKRKAFTNSITSQPSITELNKPKQVIFLKKQKHKVIPNADDQIKKLYVKKYANKPKVEDLIRLNHTNSEKSSSKDHISFEHNHLGIVNEKNEKTKRIGRVFSNNFKKDIINVKKTKLTPTKKEYGSFHNLGSGNLRTNYFKKKHQPVESNEVCKIYEDSVPKQNLYSKDLYSKDSFLKEHFNQKILMASEMNSGKVLKKPNRNYTDIKTKNERNAEPDTCRVNDFLLFPKQGKTNSKAIKSHDKETPLYEYLRKKYTRKSEQNIKHFLKSNKSKNDTAMNNYDPYRKQSNTYITKTRQPLTPGNRQKNEDNLRNNRMMDNNNKPYKIDTYVRDNGQQLFKKLSKNFRDSNVCSVNEREKESYLNLVGNSKHFQISNKSELDELIGHRQSLKRMPIITNDKYNGLSVETPKLFSYAEPIKNVSKIKDKFNSSGTSKYSKFEEEKNISPNRKVIYKFNANENKIDAFDITGRLDETYRNKSGSNNYNNQEHKNCENINYLIKYNLISDETEEFCGNPYKLLRNTVTDTSDVNGPSNTEMNINFRNTKSNIKTNRYKNLKNVTYKTKPRQSFSSVSSRTSKSSRGKRYVHHSVSTRFDKHKYIKKNSCRLPKPDHKNTKNYDERNVMPNEYDSPRTTEFDPYSNFFRRPSTNNIKKMVLNKMESKQTPKIIENKDKVKNTNKKPTEIISESSPRRNIKINKYYHSLNKTHSGVSKLNLKRKSSPKLNVIKSKQSIFFQNSNSKISVGKNLTKPSKSNSRSDYWSNIVNNNNNRRNVKNDKHKPYYQSDPKLLKYMKLLKMNI